MHAQTAWQLDSTKRRRTARVYRICVRFTIALSVLRFLSGQVLQVFRAVNVSKHRK